jgi:hypothetical protein
LPFSEKQEFVFFFEKKKQKTFVPGYAREPLQRRDVIARGAGMCADRTAINVGSAP